MWVQCGEGQLKIVDASLDELPEMTAFELLSPMNGNLRLVLG
jgi:hypothetical protein